MSANPTDNGGGTTPTRLQYSDALGEVFCVCVVGILPLLLFGLSSIEAKDQSKGLFQAMVDPIAKGQLFLYSFSLFGSLIWVFINQAKVYTKMWLGIYATFLLSPGIASIFFYGRNPDMDERLKTYIIALSVIFYLIYVSLYIRLLTHIPSRISSFGEATEKDASKTANRSKKYIG